MGLWHFAKELIEGGDLLTEGKASDRGLQENTKEEQWMAAQRRERTQKGKEEGGNHMHLEHKG